MPIPPMPTRLSGSTGPSSSASSTRETALVAGSTAGAIAFVFLIFSAIFLHVRRRQRERDLSDALQRETRKTKGAGGVGMLDEEGFIESVPVSPISDEEGETMETEKKLEGRPPRPVSASLEFRIALPAALGGDETPPVTPLQARPRQQSFLLPPRSDGGSTFREEVWPPPRQESAFVDPLLQRRGPGATEDVVRNVDDSKSSEPSTPSSSSSSTPGSASGAEEASMTRAPARTRHDSVAANALSASLSSTTRIAPRFGSGSESSATVSDDDPPWPPTPAAPTLPSTTYPAKAVSRHKRPPRLVRPSTGDAGPYVSNWLERTPRRPGTAPGNVA
uniref:Proteophosphoglycan ppg4 n=1 Tax=Mycena chlorophos TaxID=658473 RepID=A0ABQ0LV14_MYCCL|nr:predicted protein [Mycena chlorophos]